MNKGSKVKFTGRSRTGVGEIVDIKETMRGKFYEVKPDDGGKSIKVRAAQVSPV